jgi:hypothetical protein
MKSNISETLVALTGAINAMSDPNNRNDLYLNFYLKIPSHYQQC